MLQEDVSQPACIWVSLHGLHAFASCPNATRGVEIELTQAVSK